MFFEPPSAWLEHHVVLVAEVVRLLEPFRVHGLDWIELLVAKVLHQPWGPFRARASVRLARASRRPRSRSSSPARTLPCPWTRLDRTPGSQGSSPALGAVR